jgi:hypothetical protein
VSVLPGGRSQSVLGPPIENGAKLRQRGAIIIRARVRQPRLDQLDGSAVKLIVLTPAGRSKRTRPYRCPMRFQLGAARVGDAGIRGRSLGPAKR